MPFFRKSTWIDAPVEVVFGFHEEPDALERLTPPWTPVEVLERSGGIKPGGRVVLLVPVGPWRKRWVAEHAEYIPNRLFSDIQTEGPFRIWRHRHEFEPDRGGTILTELIEFSLPGGWLVDLFAAWAVKIQLNRMFAYRHETTRRICEARSRSVAKKRGDA
jgi:ligand-binding SRPBCC domain-containing protein